MEKKGVSSDKLVRGASIKTRSIDGGSSQRNEGGFGSIKDKVNITAANDSQQTGNIKGKPESGMPSEPPKSSKKKSPPGSIRDKVYSVSDSAGVTLKSKPAGKAAKTDKVTSTGTSSNKSQIRQTGGTGVKADDSGKEKKKFTLFRRKEKQEESISQKMKNTTTNSTNFASRKVKIKNKKKN